MKCATSLLSLALIAIPALASAQSYRDHQARFLQMAAQEEWDENDAWSARRFERLAVMARDSRTVTVDDLPARWRDRLKSKGRRADSYERFLELDGRFQAIPESVRTINAKNVAHAEVCLFHARHELSEPFVGTDSTELYLDCVEENLSNLRPADRDGDGLLDPDDQCPDRPEDLDGWQDADGCPDPDDDGDGILDVRDRCPRDPETMNGYEDEDGCPDRRPVPAVPALPVVYFTTDSSHLDHEARQRLDAAAATLRHHPGVHVRIVGHADSRSSNDYNLRLGQRRAGAVRDYLVRQGGLDGQRIHLSSQGEFRPAAPNDTTSGRAYNRRVELHALLPHR
ncbi:MAG: OmpA family protein [Acidobacteriota bacterium]